MKKMDPEKPEIIQVDMEIGSVIIPRGMLTLFSKNLFDAGIKWRERNPGKKIDNGRYFMIRKRGYAGAYKKAVAKSFRLMNKKNKK